MKAYRPGSLLHQAVGWRNGNNSHLLEGLFATDNSDIRGYCPTHSLGKNAQRNHGQPDAITGNSGVGF